MGNKEMHFGSERMSDDEFLEAIEKCHYPANAFHHADHLRLGWILLSRRNLGCALDEVALKIRRFATHNGKADIYHETVTRAWILLLASHDEMEFENFLQRHSSRLSRSLLHDYWSEDAINSVKARTEWVGPDLRALPEVSLRFHGASDGMLTSYRIGSLLIRLGDPLNVPISILSTYDED